MQGDEVNENEREREDTRGEIIPLLCKGKKSD